MAEPLLHRVARGEPDAVRECLAAHGPLVWALARRALPGRPEAEDLVQEVFIDLWASAGRYDPSVASESTFVALIARRRLIDFRRRQGRRPEACGLPTDLAEVAADGLRLVDLRDEARPVLEALSGLSPDQRRTLILSIFHSMTYEEIARETGWPLGTVKTHARRGLTRLRQTLESTVDDAARGKP